MTKLLHSAFILLLLTLCMPTAVLSADSAVTTDDPGIQHDDLKLILKPLMRAELKVEANAWLQLLGDKVKEISTAEIAVKDKLREISAAEEVEKKLDGVDEARQNAGQRWQRKRRQQRRMKQLQQTNRRVKQVLRGMHRRPGPSQPGKRLTRPSKKETRTAPT